MNARPDSLLRRSRPLRPALLGVAALALLALPSTASAKRGHHHDDTSYSVGIGVSSRGIDGFSFGVSRDRSYHRHYPAPYYRPGRFFPRIPSYHRRVYVNSTAYFVADGIYYRPYNHGYVVVDRPVIVERPVVIEREAPPPRRVTYAVTDDGVDPNQEIGVPPPEPDYITVWQGEQELRLMDGEFFKPTANGLVWVPTPVGAVSDVLPVGSQAVWHNDIEYFRFDGVVFRKSPDGYKVVAAPWADAKNGS
ncbi:DUF6515 family protein [Actomonas aquatica]|uniref:DUF6515 family protein n=1 Tax=Actomonas aquatica TaxID=2866162 RepID=A0ABZ1C7S1_9BACT|nr:DUF6515 family protein [Opitutus sp. WL0086]WRQ87382.1 DUF6515 family protein [Opitutus sp. WL0086]